MILYYMNFRLKVSSKFILCRNIQNSGYPLSGKIFSKISGKISSKFYKLCLKFFLRILPCDWKNIRDFLFGSKFRNNFLRAWSLYLYHLNTYIEGIQNDVQHCHSSTTYHATLFRMRENVFFANFPKATKNKIQSK